MSYALPPQKPSFFQLFFQTPMRDVWRMKMTGRLNWQRTLNLSGLPEAVQATVAQVVKQSKLWRLEKAAVCNELIAHFADGLEAKTSEEELIKNFGDTCLAAKLIRRAKKRQRPLLWHLLKWTAQGVGVFILLYAGLTLYFMNDKVVIKTDYLAQMNEVALKTPESERAWPIYREALMGWPEVNEYSRFEDKKNTIPLTFSAAVWSDLWPEKKGWDILIEGLSAHQKEIRAFREAAAKPHLGAILGVGGYQPEDVALIKQAANNGKEDMVVPLNYEIKTDQELTPQVAARNSLSLNIQYPHLSHLRRLSRDFLINDFRWSVSKGDMASALADIEANFGIAQQLQEHGNGLIYQLVGYDIQENTKTNLAFAMNKYQTYFDANTLEKVALLMQKFPAPNANYDNVDEKILLDMVQCCYTDDGNGNGHFVATNNALFQQLNYGKSNDDVSKIWASPFGRALCSLLAESRKSTALKIKSQFTQLQILSQIPIWKQPASPSGPTVVYGEDKPIWIRLRFPIESSLLNAVVLGRVIRTAARAQTTHSALQLGIALHRQKLATGAFPKQLSELVPTYLSELPVDPITGEALHYRLDENQNPIVYSVGADKIDNGGYAPINRVGDEDEYGAQQWNAKSPVSGDWILWPMQNHPLMKAQ